MFVRFLTLIFKPLLYMVFNFLLIASAFNDTGLFNEKVTTYIDASSQLLYVENSITVLNKFTMHIDSYLYIVDPLWKDNLSYIKARDTEGRSLIVNRVFIENSLLQFNISFHDDILPGESQTINVHSIFTHYFQSFPRNVKQHEKHLVLFSFNVYLYSVYYTKEQTVIVNIGHNKVESVDGKYYNSIGDYNGDALKYGPYFDMPTFSDYKSVIHYSNKSPFLTVEKLERYVRISHWGFVKVWENVLLQHSGPKFVGPYERPTAGENSAPDTRIESYISTLPEEAFDIYIKDEIGLIWSYDIDDNDLHKMKVIIRPRFIMYGGWRTQFEIGYSVPISNYISCFEHSYFKRGFHFMFPSIDIVFQHMVIKEADINIILPEGATFEEIKPYYEMENSTDTVNSQKYCYFLDVACRDVVSLKRLNLVEQHRNNLVITYIYPQFLLLSKPLVIAVSLFMLFFVFITCARLNSDTPSTCYQSRLRLPIIQPEPSTTNNSNFKKEQVFTFKKKSRKCQ